MFCVQKTAWIVTEWSTDDDSLLAVYEAVNFIDWDRDTIKMFGKDYHPSPSIGRFFATRHLELVNYPTNRVYLDANRALNIQMNLPEDVYIRSLDRCHGQIVYDYWPYNQVCCAEDIADELDRLPSAGLFLKATDELVSWIVCPFPDGKIETLLAQLIALS